MFFAPFPFFSQRELQEKLSLLFAHHIPSDQVVLGEKTLYLIFDINLT